MGTFSKTSEECLTCDYYNDCDTKRMVLCAYLENPPILSPATANLTAPLTQDILVKHDYRDVKIAENITVTIDLEDIKKQLERDFYKSLNCNFMQFGG